MDIGSKPATATSFKSPHWKFERLKILVYSVFFWIFFPGVNLGIFAYAYVTTTLDKYHQNLLHILQAIFASCFLISFRIGYKKAQIPVQEPSLRELADFVKSAPPCWMNKLEEPLKERCQKFASYVANPSSFRRPQLILRSENYSYMTLLALYTTAMMWLALGDEDEWSRNFCWFILCLVFFLMPIGGNYCGWILKMGELGLQIRRVCLTFDLESAKGGKDGASRDFGMDSRAALEWFVKEIITEEGVDMEERMFTVVVPILKQISI